MMKLNKTIIIGLIFMLLAGVIFVSDILNPIIRPITHLFLMGSSKGKDIIFFGLLGLFLILSQLIDRDIDSNKYLKISIIIGSLLLALGILLEILFRLQMGIKLNTIFASMSGTMTSTSILHTHLLKSVLGALLVQIVGPFIQSDINTAVGLYSYVPSMGFLVILLIPVLFITLVLAIQKRPWFTAFLIAFFSSCLIIGSIDGGLFATPSLLGILGLYLVYRNGYYLNYAVGTALKDEELLNQNESLQPSYRNVGFSEKRYLFNRLLVYFVAILTILIGLAVAFAGAEPEYYSVEIVNTNDTIDLGNISVEAIDYDSNANGANKVIYKVDPNYNEMELLNELKIPLNNSCEYYTVSWNIYSYL